MLCAPSFEGAFLCILLWRLQYIKVGRSLCIRVKLARDLYGVLRKSLNIKDLRDAGRGRCALSR
jgi:hypothetical protein